MGRRLSSGRSNRAWKPNQAWKPNRAWKRRATIDLSQPDAAALDQLGDERYRERLSEFVPKGPRMLCTTFRLARWFHVAIVYCFACGAAGAQQRIDFAREIQPILAENCFHCHGPDAANRQADLRLDTHAGAESMLAPGDHEGSELFRRIATDADDERMPPPDSNRLLSAAEIELIGRWIQQGATWGEHWAFVPPVRPEVPVPDRSEGPGQNETAEKQDSDDRGDQHPIDSFVHAMLAQEGIEPSPRAAPEVLLRRVSLDLTGLPPTPEQLDDFLAEPSPQGYAKVVDRLLQSPAFGERMAWDWLDAARYADTNGYQGDGERTMWPWRDWVVEALNRNLPLDQFTLWQVAGDLLPDASFEQRLASGFFRNHMINGEGGRIAEENRVEYVFDMTETLGTLWLGLTLNCCRCHDHKFDPLTQQDYYQLFAFFNQTPVSGGGGNPQTPPVLAAPSRDQQQQLDELQHQLTVARGRVQQQDDQLEAERGEDGALRELANEVEKIEKQLASLRADIPQVMIMGDLPQPRHTHVLQIGLYNKPGAEVTADVPGFLPDLPDGAAANRLGLAQWLIDDANPLMARVTVNRFWQQFFGVGLVKTPEDFGIQGESPRHHALLDWLAADFRDSGWDLKALIRQIVTSRTYQQSSRVSAEAYERDPENRLLARGPRRRLPSWMLRDQALAISGLLSPRIGGKPVNGYQPPGIWEEATFGKKKYVQDEGESLHRRTLYTFWRRIVAPTVLFDNAPRQLCSVSPRLTNTPLHALTTLNETTYVEAARAMAQRVMEATQSDPERIAWGFRLATSRYPSEEETTILLSRLAILRDAFSADVDAAERLLSIGQSPRNVNLDPLEHAAWAALCSLILNLDETITKP